MFYSLRRMSVLLLLGALTFSAITGVSIAQTLPGDQDPNPSASECLALKSSNLRYRSTDKATNGEVSLVQDFLQSKGYLNSEPTGFFGIMTVNAVKAFQKANGIDATGYVGPLTRALIGEISCNGSITTPPPTIPGCPAGAIYNSLTGEKCGATNSTSAVYENVPLPSFPPGSYAINNGTNVLYRYKVTAPSTNSVTISSETFRISASIDVENIVLYGFSDSLYSTPLSDYPSVGTYSYQTGRLSGPATSFRVNNGYTQTINFTITNSSSGPLRPLVIPAGQTTYFQVMGVVSSDAMGDQIVTSHAGLNDQTLGVVAPTQPSITVTSPNGGETYKIGENTNITWTPSPQSSSLYGPFDIYLNTYMTPCTTQICPMIPAVAAVRYTLAKNYLIGTVISTTTLPFGWKVGTSIENSNIPAGMYTVSVCKSDQTVCDSSDSYFKIVSTQSQPTVSVVGTPTLALTYDSARNESSLTAKYTVSIRAGSSSIQVIGNSPWIQFIDSKGMIDNLNSSQRSMYPITRLNSTTDQYGLITYIIPAGTAATFAASRTVSPQQMFAGSYYAVFKTIPILNPAAPGGNDQLTVPEQATNKVTIVGEKSPYITSVTNPVNTGNIITINGVRFAGPYLYLDGQQILLKGLGSSLGETQISFPVPSGWAAGSHYLQASNAYGLSNKFWFQVGGTSTQSPTVSVVGSPTLTLTYDSSRRESQLTASATVKIVAGATDVRVPAKGTITLVVLALSQQGTASSIWLNSETSTFSAPTNLPIQHDIASMDYYTIRAGTTALFTVTRTLNPQQMFAGRYQASVAYVNTLDSNNQITNNPLPPNTSNIITIVGETSPYLTSVTESVNIGDTLYIQGARLNSVYGAVIVYIDGAMVNIASYPSNDGTMLKFAVPTTLATGSHYVEVANNNGKSNRKYFQVLQSTVQPSAQIISGTQTSTSTPMITGVASGTSQIGISIGNAGGKVYSSGIIPVVNSNWAITVYPALANGQYTIYVYSGNNLLTTGSLTVQTVSQPAPTPSVTLTSPNGGETWGIGSVQNITWKTTGISSPNDKMTIYIIPAGDSSMNINLAQQVPNTGSYSYTVDDPARFSARSPLYKSGNMFKIFVCAQASGNNSLCSYAIDYGDSDFKIVSLITQPAVSVVSISNTSATAVGVDNGAGAIYMASVNMKFRLTNTGNSDAYISKTPASLEASSNAQTSSMGAVTISPSANSGDTSAAFAIPAGSSRDFYWTGTMNNTGGTAGTKQFSITKIYYGDSSSNLQSHSITEGLEGLRVTYTLVGATQPPLTNSEILDGLWNLVRSLLNAQAGEAAFVSNFDFNKSGTLTSVDWAMARSLALGTLSNYDLFLTVTNGFITEGDSRIGATQGSARYLKEFDVDRNGEISSKDIQAIKGALLEKQPASTQSSQSSMTPAQIELAIKSLKGSLAEMSASQPASVLNAIQTVINGLMKRLGY